MSGGGDQIGPNLKTRAERGVWLVIVAFLRFSESFCLLRCAEPYATANHIGAREFEKCVVLSWDKFVRLDKGSCCLYS
jgi:hypothetical protein